MTSGGGVHMPRPIGPQSLAPAAAVLLACFYYTFAYLFLVPYPGLDYDARWTVVAVADACKRDPVWCAAASESLQPGDRILSIGSFTYEEYTRQRSRVPFAEYPAGDSVPVKYVHRGIVREGTWPMLGPSTDERLARLPGMLLGIPFWLAGTCVLLFLRPRDVRWLLLVLFNYLGALWLTSGAVSAFRVGGSSLLLGAVSCLLVPVGLHLHLVVPNVMWPRLHRWLIYPLYVVAVILAIVQIWLPLPPMVLSWLSLLFIVVSLGPLLLRLALRLPSPVLLATRLMLLGIALASGPGLVLWIIPELVHPGNASSAPLGFITGSLVVQPFFYIYALYKHYLGSLEFRANRLLSLYSFFLLYVTAFMLVFLVGSPWLATPGAMQEFSLAACTVFVIAALFLREPFQRWVDRIAYGTEHAPDEIIRIFADRIPRALDREALVALLTQEVAPSLLIRQSALYLAGRVGTSLFYADGVPICAEREARMPLQGLQLSAGQYMPPDPSVGELFGWVRVSVAIEVGGEPVGLWLLGARDPDDYYPRRDIELLTTLGNQIGVALENIRLFENLQRRAAELERAYDELQELDRLKDQFVQNVSHELRTPLTVIQASADLLLEGILGDMKPEHRSLVDSIAQRARGITRLVNDILTVQESSLEHLNLEPVDLAVLARSCVEEAREIAAKTANERPALAFVLDAPGDVPQISGDRSRLHRVFENLLENSIKFSPNGGIVTVRVYPCFRQFAGAQTDKQQLAVEVSISDEGVGIPAGQVDQIWRQFYQVDGSSTRRFGGAGLGLAIARSIVEVHGGVIWAESAENAGSTFRFVLPAIDPLSGEPPVPVVLTKHPPELIFG